MTDQHAAMRQPEMTAESGCLWTHQETAAFLGISPATLHDLNYKGTGPRSFKVGRHRRYAPGDVFAWLDRRASDAPSSGSGRVVHNLSPRSPRAVGRA